MMQRAQQLLAEIYGFDHFQGQQAEVIAAVLAGQDALVLMPTGGGKSLCYQIPALLREGMGVIVSPLIALMQDQVRALTLLGIRAAYLNSTLTPAEQQRVVREAESGELDLLYVAPERLLQEETLTMLTSCAIALIAIDEAHCVSQWGHDFRQDYLGLDVLAERFPHTPRLALTATADERTREEIVARLALNHPQRFISGFDRPNIRYTVTPKTDPRRQLLGFLTHHTAEAGIIYCLSRKSVESTAAWLRERGHDALPYHAGLPKDVRGHHQERFLSEDGVIVVATIAFGMGIDKPDVRFVAHLDLPKSIEGYYQETGRAGRDGEPAEAWMIYGLQDVVRLSQMLDQSSAPDAQKRLERHKLDALLGWCEVTACRRRSLLAYFGDHTSEACGNCDICLTPPTTWDATVDSQKLLSCVARTGQRFGAGHVIDVLRGKRTDKVAQHRHATLSTFGIGAHHSEAQWRSVIRQLLVQGYLRSDVDRFGALVLTGKSRPLLRGEVHIELREDAAAPRAKRATKKTTSTETPGGPVWEALRACRRRLAEEQGVPPYVIFHDATLRTMAALKPTSLAEMLDISGVGETKLERYGEVFLEVLRAEAIDDLSNGL